MQKKYIIYHCSTFQNCAVSGFRTLIAQKKRVVQDAPLHLLVKSHFWLVKSHVLPLFLLTPLWKLEIAVEKKQ